MAQLPSKYSVKTFADYGVTSDNAEAIKIAKWFINKHPPKSLYFYGGVGIGKTFLATLIGQECLKHEESVRFIDVPTLLEKLKQEFKGGDAQALLDDYCNCDLLILDDLGAGQVTEWSVGVLYQIINRRYNSDMRTVITSNFDLENPKGLQARLSVKNKDGQPVDSYSATRITSRLSEMCIQAFLGTNDRRRKS